MNHRLYTLAAFAASLFGCAREVTTRSFPRKEIISQSTVHSINLPGNRSPVRMLYVGCGHLILEYSGDVIVMDPYFSIQPLTARKIKTHREDYDRYLSMVRASGIDVRKASSVWIAHMHYDHVMDLPILLRDSLVGPNAFIYGNAYGSSILQHFVRPGQFVPLSIKPDDKGTWIKAATNIRVMPIVSDHAPHVKFGPITIHAMKGDIDPDYFAEFDNAEGTTKMKKWKEGDVYSFLVDFLAGDTIALRMFIQTSASHYPLGQPSPDVLKEHPVDVAVLCLASSNTVKPYPVEILESLNPKQTVFVHWEDFFKRSEFGHYKLVRLTNFKKILKRMEKAGIPVTMDKFVMPQPGTVMSVIGKQ